MSGDAEFIPIDERPWDWAYRMAEASIKSCEQILGRKLRDGEYAWIIGQVASLERFREKRWREAQKTNAGYTATTSTLDEGQKGDQS